MAVWAFFTGFYKKQDAYRGGLTDRRWKGVRRWVIHVDMDAFFASVEQRDHEAYRGKPVIVGGLGARGVVSTASYEARVFGVHSAMPMARARQKCPQGIFLPVDHRLYEAVSAEVFEIFHEFSPLVEPLSIDEAFLDVSGMEKLERDLTQYARRIKSRIKEKTGLIASAGLAPNKFLAKLASGLQKPDGLVVIGYGEEKAVLENLPLKKIWGIGAKSAEKLKALGFKTAGELASADERQLIRHFGKAACQFIALANGRDDRPVEPCRSVKSIGSEITFPEDLTRPEQVEKALLTLAEKVGWRLRRGGFTAGTITVKIRTTSFETVTRSETLQAPTHFDGEIYKRALALYRQARPSGGIRLLGISGSHLNENAQESLFPEENRRRDLYAAVDHLKERFGEGIITKANLLKKWKNH